MRQLAFGARGCRGVAGPVLSLFMLRVSRAVVVACADCGEGEGRACQMFNDAPAVQERLRRQVTEIAFGWRGRPSGF